MSRKPTYAAFLRENKKRQRARIRSERERYGEASRLFGLYSAAMALLELHPLDWNEISTRLNQLERMDATVEDTHGDSETMREIYDTLEGRDWPPRRQPTAQQVHDLQERADALRAEIGRLERRKRRAAR